MLFIEKDIDFKFKINHSLQGYKSKEEAKIALSSYKTREFNKGVENPEDQMMKMSFVLDEITLDQFVELATSGYSFCNLFKYDPDKKYLFTWNRYRNYLYPEYKRGRNKGTMKLQMKSERFFLGSQCFFVDIDFTQYDSVEEFIDKIPLQPTVTYMSFSDKEFKKDNNKKMNPKYDPCLGIKSRRFRLCYIFDDIIYGKDKFLQISKEIHRMVEDSTGEEIQDPCGMNPSQYFNGAMSKEVYVTGFVYDINDFIGGQNDLHTDETIEEPLISDYIECPSIAKDDKSFTQQAVSPYLISDMKQLDYDEFMKTHRHRYKYYYRKDDRLWEDNYQIIDEEYFALFYNVSPLKDGNKRRKKLFERMCLRRVMFPDITPDEVLFCAYEDLNRFIDNSEDPISIDCLVRNVKNAFSLSIDNIKEMYSYNIVKLKENAPKHKIIYMIKGANTPGERNKRKAEIRYKRYDKIYDCTLSVKENAAKIGVSIRTILRYRKSRGFDKGHKTTNEELKQIIDPCLSVRNNIEKIQKEYNIKVSVGKLSKVLRDVRSQNKEIKKNYDGCQYYIIINDSSVALPINSERNYCNYAIDSSVDSSFAFLSTKNN